MTKLGIIFGGQSGEHEISLMSATSVIHAADKSKYQIVAVGITKEGKWLLYDGPVDMIETGEWEDYAKLKLLSDPEAYDLTVLGSTRSLKDLVDVVFPVLHGPMGEDGTVQGLLELLGVPYVGCGVLGSSLAMDKIASKKIFEREGLPVCKYVAFTRDEVSDDLTKCCEKTEAAFPYPVFVKPANMGSSVGVSKAEDRQALKEAIREAAVYDRRIVIEESINCREVETGIIGNAVPLAAAVGEIIPSKEFYDYEAKYGDGGKSQILVPAPITSEQAKEIKDIAIRAYKALDCRGFSRVDFFLEKNTGKIYLNEINTLPGFTRFSMFPTLWKQAGLEYAELIDRLVGYAMEK